MNKAEILAKIAELEKLLAELPANTEETTEETTEGITEDITNGTQQEDNTELNTGHNTEFEESTTATEQEPTGTNDVLMQSIDLRFATYEKRLTVFATEFDKLKVAVNNIMTRIELVEDITDNITEVDNDELLSESLAKMLL